MSGIPKLCKVQKTSGYREVKKPAPKVIPGLNPIIFDMAAKHTGWS